ncbi:hypothetical protein EDD93_1783 [Streptomyces sp. 840.1]|nr:hypothetical protein EDD93_1783 [Streptomyces sp. 840.1]
MAGLLPARRLRLPSASGDGGQRRTGGLLRWEERAGRTWWAAGGGEVKAGRRECGGRWRRGVVRRAHLGKRPGTSRGSGVRGRARMAAGGARTGRRGGAGRGGPGRCGRGVEEARAACRGGADGGGGEACTGRAGGRRSVVRIPELRSDQALSGCRTVGRRMVRGGGPALVEVPFRAFRRAPGVWPCARPCALAGSVRKRLHGCCVGRPVALDASGWGKPPSHSPQAVDRSGRRTVPPGLDAGPASGRAAEPASGGARIGAGVSGVARAGGHEAAGRNTPTRALAWEVRAGVRAGGRSGSR